MPTLQITINGEGSYASFTIPEAAFRELIYHGKTWVSYDTEARKWGEAIETLLGPLATATEGEANG